MKRLILIIVATTSLVGCKSVLTPKIISETKIDRSTPQKVGHYYNNALQNKDYAKIVLCFHPAIRGDLDRLVYSHMWIEKQGLSLMSTLRNKYGNKKANECDLEPVTSISWAMFRIAGSDIQKSLDDTGSILSSLHFALVEYEGEWYVGTLTEDGFAAIRKNAQELAWTTDMYRNYIEEKLELIERTDPNLKQLDKIFDN